MAKRAAVEAGVKLMVHIGDTEKRYDEKVIHQLLPILEEGDIVTHLFTANPGGVIDSEGKLAPEAKEAQERGVWLDTAHGRMNFSFEVGQRVLDQGLLPHCISTDLTLPGRQPDRPQHDRDDDPLPGHGVHPGAGGGDVHLQPGQGPGPGKPHRLAGRGATRPTFQFWDMTEGDWVVYDVVGGSRRHRKGGGPGADGKARRRCTRPGWGPRPWGWEPDTA